MTIGPSDTKIYIESLEHGVGFIFIEGWIADAWHAPLSLPIKLTVNDYPPRLIEALSNRADVVAAGIAKRASGFRVEVPIVHLDHGPLCIEIATAAGDRLFKSGPLFPRQFRPRGWIDRADAEGIHGWVYAPDAAHNERGLFLDIGEYASVSFRLHLERSDVQKLYHTNSSLLGFLVKTEALVAAGLRVSVGYTDTKSEPTEFRLRAGNEILATKIAHLRLQTKGRIERHHAGKIFGWAINELDAETPVTVRISLDKIPYATTRANRARSDLTRIGIANSSGGFELPLRFVPSNGNKHTVTAEVVGGGTLDGTIEIELPNHRNSIDWIYAISNPKFDNGRTSIIVPVYNAPQDTARCLASVVANSGKNVRLIIIDDASSDPKIAAILDNYRGLNNIEVYHNRVNIGYVNTCNLGIDRAGEDDVILLNSDTVVSSRWVTNLRLAAYSRPHVATVTPLSDNAGVFSVPEINVANPLPPGFEHSDMARLVLYSSRAAFPSVPTGNGFCLYIRRDAIQRIGCLDVEAFPRGYGEENDFCMRALRAGLINVVDDRTYVHHVRSASFLAGKGEQYAAGQNQLKIRYPEYGVLNAGYADDAELLAIRWRIRSARAKASIGDQSPPKPRILFVIASQTGGTPQTNEDLMRGLVDVYQPWLLRCDSQTIYLSVLSSTAITEIERIDLCRPIILAAHQSEEYNSSIARILIDYGFELVHVRHFAWHGLQLFSICNKLAIPIILSLHDFYTICPTVNLIDTECNACCLIGKTSDKPCEAELWAVEGTPPLNGRFIEHWRAQIWDAIQHCDDFVTTSPFARDLLRKAYPQLDTQSFHVIPHGRSFEGMHALAAPVLPKDVLRVLVPGNISAAKGALLISAMANLDNGRRVQFHILGDQGKLAEGPGIILHGRYLRHEFAERVAKIRPHIGAVLSLWPETYCHTLTELWACGVPVLGLDMGAVGERLRRHGGGWLLPRASTPEEILALIATITDEPENLRSCTAAVLSWQTGYGATYTREMMAAGYDRLYRSVIDRRLKLTQPEQRRLWGLINYDAPTQTPTNASNTRDVVVELDRMPDLDIPEFKQLFGFVIRFGTPALLRNAILDCVRHGGGRPVILDARPFEPRTVADIVSRYGDALSGVIVEPAQAAALAASSPIRIVVLEESNPIAAALGRIEGV